MKAKILDFPTHTSSPPHCCIVSGRRDGQVIDFGDLTVKACGPGDPRVYIRVSRVEHAAKELLGMVPLARLKELEDELEEANAEAGRLRKIVAGKLDLEQAEEDLRESLEAPTEEAAVPTTTDVTASS